MAASEDMPSGYSLQKPVSEDNNFTNPSYTQPANTDHNVPEPQNANVDHNVSDPQTTNADHNVTEPQTANTEHNVPEPQTVNTDHNVPEPSPAPEDVSQSDMVGGSVEPHTGAYREPTPSPPATPEGSGSEDSPPPPYTNADTLPIKRGPQNGAVESPAGSNLQQEAPPGDVQEKKDDKKEEKDPVAGIGETFRFADTKDRLLIVLGIVSALIQGTGFPALLIVFGEMSDSFINFGSIINYVAPYLDIWQETCFNMTGSKPCNNVTLEYLEENPIEIVPTCIWLNAPPGCPEIFNITNSLQSINLLTETRVFALYFFIIGLVVLVVGYLRVLGWQTAAINQTQRIRTRLYWSILRQEIGWFDTHEIGELNTRLSDDISKIEAGIGDKLGLFFQWMAMFFAGIIIGFVYDWRLTLVILAVSPLLVGAGGVMGKLGASMTGKELAAYAKAGAVAEEVFAALRTVVAFGGETKECQRYNSNLKEARDFGIKKGIINGVAMGIIFLVLFASYGLAFWYGSKLVFDPTKDLTPGKMMIVFFCIVFGTFALGNAAPNIQDFSAARGAAYAVYKIIDSVPHIDSSSPDGIKDRPVEGNVEFVDINFNYPSRPEVQVLHSLSMKINVGQTVALVGPSGCGKSTTVQLLQRFYDPLEGQVLIDGTDIREFNVKWLRQQIGVVSQEPVLFATSIIENIRYGHDSVSNDDIISACKEANAHDFITQLPQQYDTLVGERGAQLSGGQKQRIAIARALVRNPKVLLLDEATSALDTESEATVQVALDVAGRGRTTLVIAHRLSTIRTADVIVGMKDGRMVEQGTHEELMKRQGLYYDLVMNQHMEDEEEDEDIPAGEKVVLSRAVSARDSGRLKKGTSVTSTGKKEDQEEENVPEAKALDILAMNKPEWPLMVCGCFCSLITGSIQPLFAVIFAEMLGVYAIYDKVDAWNKVELYSGMFVVLGLVSALSMSGMGFCFARSGEILTQRMRELSFKYLLRQEVAYFDDPKNNVGAVCTRLATDASAVQGATGSRLSTFMQSMSAIGAGIIIGFIYSWKLTLLLIAFAPFMILSGYIEMRVWSGASNDNKKALEKAGSIAIESIENIRTVVTLSKEDKFYNDYCQALIQPFKQSKKAVHLTGLLYASSQTVVFFAYAGTFVLGGYLVETGDLDFVNMFKVYAAVIFGAMAAGNASSFAPDYGKAKASATKIFSIIKRQPAIDSSDTSGEQPASYSGSVQMQGVQFTYPNRPDVTVLRSLDLEVLPGQTVALVGASGCGKSTTVQLLERFYDAQQGSVRLDGQDLRQLSLQWARSQMGIVSQEPILFDRSIQDNIAYGDNSRDVPMAEIIEAARSANIHSFIETLPQGYDTNVGAKGAQLSGGQKQRVAIARALVRNPKLLLLDEATSALDTESEQIVQAALDKAQEGRTCIVIAHRLSTIQNADNILVIQHGRVVESGTHSELLQKRGQYHRLNTAQLNRA